MLKLSRMGVVILPRDIDEDDYDSLGSASILVSPALTRQIASCCAYYSYSALKLVGGRLLPGPDGPASFLMYESASGERFTVYTAKASIETTQMRYTTQDNDGALFWADHGVGYVVSGGSDRDRLTQVARLVYDQTEKNGG